MGIYGVHCYLPYLDLNRAQSPIAPLVQLGSPSMFHAVLLISIRIVIYIAVLPLLLVTVTILVYKVAVIHL